MLCPPTCSEGCPLLEQLNISWCDQVTKDGIQALVRSCPGLKGLFLKGCTQVPSSQSFSAGLETQRLKTDTVTMCKFLGKDVANVALQQLCSVILCIYRNIYIYRITYIERENDLI